MIPGYAGYLHIDPLYGDNVAPVVDRLHVRLKIKMLWPGLINISKIYISYSWTYDLYGLVSNAFDVGKAIMRAKGMGVWALEIETFWACEIASSR
jgi:hypothetical protein